MFSSSLRSILRKSYGLTFLTFTSCPGQVARYGIPEVFINVDPIRFKNPRHNQTGYINNILHEYYLKYKTSFFKSR